MKIKKILLGATFLTLSINTLKAEEIIPIETDIIVYESKEIPIKNSHKNRKKDRIENRKEFEKHDDFKHHANWYQDFKNKLENDYGLSYSFDLTYMPQRGAPNGSKTPQQLIWSPSVDWTLFNSKIFGSGQLQFAYSGTQYWGEQAFYLQDRLNIGSGINDYTDNELQFSQLVYSHTLPGAMNWLSVNVGQYSLYFIDGTSQDYNQQTGFISYSLSQNGSATYPVASFGAYLQFTPTSEWMMQVGFQDATNIAGKRIDFSSIGDKKYTTYSYISWNPTFKKTWAGQYMFLFYQQPAVPKQDADSTGWSFSFSQYFGNMFNIFGRLNGSSGNVVPIRKSIVAGFGFKDPFSRNPNDYLGMSMGFNSMSKEALGQTNIHKYENVFEAQYVIGLGKYITITPDIQFFLNPALDTQQNTAVVYSLRFGLAI